MAKNPKLNGWLNIETAILMEVAFQHMCKTWPDHFNLFNRGLFVFNCIDTSLFNTIDFELRTNVEDMYSIHGENPKYISTKEYYRKYNNKHPYPKFVLMFRTHGRKNPTLALDVYAPIGTFDSYSVKRRIFPEDDQHIEVGPTE